MQSEFRPGPYGGYRTKTEQKNAIAAQKRREREIRRRSLAVAEEARRRHKEELRRYKKVEASEKAKRRETVKLWGKEELKRLLDARIELEGIFALQASDRWDRLAEKLAEPLVIIGGDPSINVNEHGRPIPEPFKATASQCRAKLHNTRTQYKRHLEEVRDARAAGQPAENIPPFDFAEELDKIFGVIALDPPGTRKPTTTGRPRGRPRRSDAAPSERRTDFAPRYNSSNVPVDQTLDFGDFDFMDSTVDRARSADDSGSSSGSSTDADAEHEHEQPHPPAGHGAGPSRMSLEEGLTQAYHAITNVPPSLRSPTRNALRDSRAPTMAGTVQSATERQNVGASFLESFFRHQTEQQERRFERERQEREERRAERERDREHERRRDLEERKLDRQEAAEERAANMQIFLAGLAEVMKS